MESYKGSVASKSKKGNSMKGDDGEWYSLFSADDFYGEWKDQVEFLWEFDKTGKYRNIKKGTMKVTGGASSGGTSAPAGKPYSNLGVELGHASNVATNMAVAHFAQEEIGSPQYYKWWVNATQDVYKMMKGLRSRYEAGEGEAKIPEAVPVAVSPAPEVDDSDLF